MIEDIHAILRFLAAITASVFGTYIYMNWKIQIKNRRLRKILNIHEDEIRFIFSHNDVTPFVLPRTTEDVLAMNNVISALILAGCDQGRKMYDTAHIPPAARRMNIITFSSSESNGMTEEIERELITRGLPIFRFAQDRDNRQWIITDAHGCIYPSRSFWEAESYKKEGVAAERLPEKRFRDLAVITKASNPWNPLNKVFIIAGIRGIGTWGAVECLKKNWREIYGKLGRRKTEDFSALVSVIYENYDIIRTEVINLNRLDTAAAP